MTPIFTLMPLSGRMSSCPSVLLFLVLGFLTPCRRIYVDTRLQHVMPVLKLKKQSFWDRGDFPPVIQNGSQTVILDNPWVNGTKAAPFDQCGIVFVLFLGT